MSQWFFDPTQSASQPTVTHAWAQYCIAAGFQITIFEASERIGGVFGAQAGYDEGALVSSKFLTAFSDFRHADSEPPHVSFLA